MRKDKPLAKVFYEVDVGETERDYQGGNYLNAIDEVTWFFIDRGLDQVQAVACLTAYIKQLEEK